MADVGGEWAIWVGGTIPKTTTKTQITDPATPSTIPAIAMPPPPRVPELRAIRLRETAPMITAGTPVTSPQHAIEAIPVTSDATARPSLRPLAVAAVAALFMGEPRSRFP